MKRSGWYMIVYDIADPKRLGKVHRMMKKNGLPVQKSVFFYHGNEQSTHILLDKICAAMDPDADDLRAYPIIAPDFVWTTGGVFEHLPLVNPDNKNKQLQVSQQTKTLKKKSWLRKLFSRKKQ
jgi:CRISPR-associated endonuclease Cas2